MFKAALIRSSVAYAVLVLVSVSLAEAKTAQTTVISPTASQQTGMNYTDYFSNSADTNTTNSNTAGYDDHASTVAPYRLDGAEEQPTAPITATSYNSLSTLTATKSKTANNTIGAQLKEKFPDMQSFDNKNTVGAATVHSTADITSLQMQKGLDVENGGGLAPNSKDVLINEQGICGWLDNNHPQYQYFVPKGGSNDLSSFILSHPATVQMARCCPPKLVTVTAGDGQTKQFYLDVGRQDSVGLRGIARLGNNFARSRQDCAAADNTLCNTTKWTQTVTDTYQCTSTTGAWTLTSHVASADVAVNPPVFDPSVFDPGPGTNPTPSHDPGSKTTSPVVDNTKSTPVCTASAAVCDAYAASGIVPDQAGALTTQANYDYYIQQGYTPAQAANQLKINIAVDVAQYNSSSATAKAAAEVAYNQNAKTLGVAAGALCQTGDVNCGAAAATADQQAKMLVPSSRSTATNNADNSATFVAPVTTPAITTEVATPVVTTAAVTSNSGATTGSMPTPLPDTTAMVAPVVAVPPKTIVTSPAATVNTTSNSVVSGNSDYVDTSYNQNSAS